jgi:hypothetical protein
MGIPQRSNCPICDGSGWVCEDHPDKPWQHDACGGAGSPCICNPNGVVEFVAVFAKAETRPRDEPLH